MKSLLLPEKMTYAERVVLSSKPAIPVAETEYCRVLYTACVGLIDSASTFVASPQFSSLCLVEQQFDPFFEFDLWFVTQQVVRFRDVREAVLNVSRARRFVDHR